MNSLNQGTVAELFENTPPKNPAKTTIMHLHSATIDKNGCMNWTLVSKPFGADFSDEVKISPEAMAVSIALLCSASAAFLISASLLKGE